MGGAMTFADELAEALRQIHDGCIRADSLDDAGKQLLGESIWAIAANAIAYAKQLEAERDSLTARIIAAVPTGATVH